MVESINSSHKATKRSYEFYGTVNDWYIPNFDSCYPIIDPNVNNVVYYTPVTGIDHVFLGHFLAQQIADKSNIWMKLVKSNLK